MDSNLTGRYLPSVRIAIGDTAIPLPTNAQEDLDGVHYLAVLMTVEDNDIRIRFGVDPTQGATSQGHLIKKNETLRIIGKDNITSFRVIAAVSSAAAVIQLTPEF